MSDPQPVSDPKLVEAGILAFEIMTSVLEEHEDVYVSLACTGRLLTHGAPAVVAEIAKVVEEWKSKSVEKNGNVGRSAAGKCLCRPGSNRAD